MYISKITFEFEVPSSLEYKKMFWERTQLFKEG